jgi:hypothetical protein
MLPHSLEPNAYAGGMAEESHCAVCKKNPNLHSLCWN